VTREGSVPFIRFENKDNLVSGNVSDAFVSAGIVPVNRLLAKSSVSVDEETLSGLVILDGQQLKIKSDDPTYRVSEVATLPSELSHR
jgi:hypothetical protein